MKYLPNPQAASQVTASALGENNSYLFNVPLGHQAPAFAISFDDLGLGVLALGEALVLAALSCRTHLGVALVHQHPIEALGVKAARVLIRGLAVALGNLRYVSSVYLHFTARFIHLKNTLEWSKYDFRAVNFIAGVTKATFYIS